MPRAATQKPDRRDEIAKALYGCISKKGYASTTLTDIAAQADMSPSHIGYYFENKAAILEYYCFQLCKEIEDGLPSLDDSNTDQIIETITGYAFGDGDLNTAFLGVIHELSGLAVHDKSLRKIKSDHAMVWRRYLESFFDQRSPTVGLSASEAAMHLHALMVGLQANALFDANLDHKGAYKLFSRALHELTQ